MISNCGHDERGKYSGGKAGDQTGTEWQVINWYNRPWKCVLRHPDATTRKLIAQMAKAAAVNNMVGYCQSHRGTFWTNLADSNFDPRLRRPLLYPAELRTHLSHLHYNRLHIFIRNLLYIMRSIIICKWKAGDGNRTHVSSLEGWCSTIELHPHKSG